MDVVDRESLDTLARHYGFPCVSIYLPTHRGAAHKEQDRIRFRNLLDRVTEHLAADGVRTRDSEALLAGLHDVSADAAFWRETSDGLACFAAHGVTRAFRLDTDFTESVGVGDRFAVRQLIPALHEDVKFWLLVLSKGAVRLYAANHVSIEEVLIPGAPTSIEDAMRYEDAGHDFQFHPQAASTASGGHGASVFYGGGGLPDVEKEHTERFLQLVEGAVDEVVRASGKPLILAGVEYEVALYRALCSYPLLAEEALFGNFDETSAASLHSRSKALMAEHTEHLLWAKLRELREKAASPVVSEDLGEILVAAHAGRVRTLFVDGLSSSWGRYDAATGKSEMHPMQVSGDQDLTDVATSETLLHGGDVHVLAPHQIPAQPTLTPPAAILRY